VLTRRLRRQRRRVGVPDLELGLTARDSEAVLGDGDRRPLTNDVATEMDPRGTRELESQARRFGERAVQRRWDVQRLEDDQSGADSPRVRSQPPKASLLRRLNAAGQVDHEQVDRSTRQQRTGERKRLARVCRPHDDEPAQVDAATDRLERIECTREVHERDDRAGRLGFGHPAQREGGLAARDVSADRRACLARQPA
jgi:hypothetical protein